MAVSMTPYEHADEVWKNDALCRNAAPGVFFPDATPVTPYYTAKVRAEWCEQCPVQRACYEYALRHRLRYGIWGGYNFTDERQRRRAKGCL